MNEQDKKTFKEWWETHLSVSSSLEVHVQIAWQAACELKQKEIDARKSELEYAAKILTDVQADKLRMLGEIQKLQEENKKLRETKFEIEDWTK